MWEAVALTVAAAAGNNIGKVLQKQGTKGLPQLSLDLKVIKRYGTSRTWVTGVAVDVAGAVLMLKAVSQAPVSIVQPVSGCGLAVLAVFSHFYLHEAMHGLDWVGVAMAAMGTVGNDIIIVQAFTVVDVFQSFSTSVVDPSASLTHQNCFPRWFVGHLLHYDSSCCIDDDHTAVGATGEGQKKGHISVVRLLLFFSWLALFFGVLNWWARSGKRRHQKYEPLESQLVLSRDVDVIEEIASGMEAGACFGLSATVCKMGFIMAESGMSSWFVPAGIAAGICCSASGFFCQTRGLKDGRAVVVSTCAAVASIVIGVLMGLFALGESLPGSSFGRYLLLLAWTLIVVGIIVLLTSEKLGPMLPRSLRRILKPKSSVQQKGSTRSGGGSVSRRDVTGSTLVHVTTGTANGQLKTPPSKYRPSD